MIILNEAIFTQKMQEIKTAILSKITEIQGYMSSISTTIGENVPWIDGLNEQLRDGLTDINTELVTKGSTSATDYSEVPAKIEAISTGITPTGTISITQNGTYDVTNYASASVDVPSAIYAMRIGYFEWNDAYDTLTHYTSYNIINLFIKIPQGATELKVTERGLINGSRDIVLCDNVGATTDTIGNYSSTTISDGKINVSDTHNYVCIAIRVANTDGAGTFVFE